MDLVPFYLKFTVGSHSSNHTFVHNFYLWHTHSDGMHQGNSGLSILLEDASLMWTRESRGSMQQPSRKITCSITSAAGLLLLCTEHIWFCDCLVGATKHFNGFFIYQLKKCIDLFRNAVKYLLLLLTTQKASVWRMAALNTSNL